MARSGLRGNRITYPVLTGYDTRGIVYDAGEFILRQVSPEYFNKETGIYNAYVEHNLQKCGIVETEIDMPSNSLRHRKYTITYPYEWTANMFRDAVRFHINLFLELDKYGLTLKDALPNNILFDFGRPVFVDFFSIVFKDELTKEEWLDSTKYHDARFAVFDMMFKPYLLVPFLSMSRQDFISARKMLSENACNCAGAPSGGMQMLSFRGIKSITGIRRQASALMNFIGLNLKRSLYGKKQGGFLAFCNYLLDLTGRSDVTPSQSGYVTYYSEKKEDFSLENKSDWKDKQKIVCRVIEEMKPTRVLDIGANTGWFSILAEKLGAEVIATDIDESSIDRLYLKAKKEGLKILPLLMSFDDFNREIFGVEYDDPAYKGRDFKSRPLFISASERLNSDMVLALGLAHHLILGEGRRMEEVFDVLSKLALKTLILEFIDMKDSMIQGEPSFFKNISGHTEVTYNLEKFIETGKKYFKTVDILNSHPETRKLLVFGK